MLSEQNINDRIMQLAARNVGCTALQIALDISVDSECNVDLPALLENFVTSGKLVEVQYDVGKNYYQSIYFPGNSAIELISENNKAVSVLCNGLIAKRFDSNNEVRIIRY